MTVTTSIPTTPTRPSGRRRAFIAVVVVMAALVFLVWKGLGDATVYFKTADEAVAEKDDLGGRKFRLEGVVVAGSTRTDDDGVEFQVEENGATVDVVHRGDPPELFRAGIPVVLEGRWSGDHFASEQMLVKHTSEYRKDNPDRVEEYDAK